MRRTILLTLLVVLAAAGTAHGSAAEVIRDCTDDEVLQGSYTQAELRSALANLGADADQYTNCRRVIKQAQLAALSGGGGSGGGAAPGGGTTAPGGAADPGAGGGESATTTAPGDFGGFADVPADPLETATPEEQAQLDEVTAVAPAGLDRTASIAGSDLPVPLWIALAAGALALVAFAANELRRRVVARRSG